MVQSAVAIFKITDLGATNMTTVLIVQVNFTAAF